MKYELFKKIIDDLSVFPNRIKMLRLTANGEPLLNQKLPEMIMYAKQKNVADHLEIVTNASLLTHDLGKAIADAGLDRARISIEAIDAEGYYDLTGNRIDWNEFIDNLSFFYNNKGNCEVYIKTVDATVETKEKKELFYKIFEGICDKISIEHIIPIWSNYQQLNEDFSINEGEGLHGDKIREVKICPFPFYSCVINPEGQVTACCNDWRRKIVIGNVVDESMYKIWHGEKIYSFWHDMLKKGRRNSSEACALCEYPNYDAVDNIDEQVETILSNIEKAETYAKRGNKGERL